MPSKLFKVSVNPLIIKWARESSGYSVEEISVKLKISIEVYKSWESGEESTSYSKLEKLADYFKRPVSVFFLQEPPKETPVKQVFRLLPESIDTFSREFLLALRKTKYLQANAIQIMKDLSIKSTPNISTIDILENPNKIARHERGRMALSLETQFKWKTGYDALKALRSKLEQLNILIFQISIPINQVRGFCLTEKELPVIVLNSSDHILARNFTLLHEYAHLLLNYSEVYTGENELIIDSNSKKVERWCDQFAAEFLMPKEAIEQDHDFQQLIQSLDNISDKLSTVSKKFKVSKQWVWGQVLNYQFLFANLPILWQDL